MRKLRVTPAPNALGKAPHFDFQTGGFNRWISCGVVVEVDDASHWRSAVRDGDWLAADGETAKLLGVQLPAAPKAGKKDQ